MITEKDIRRIVREEIKKFEHIRLSGDEKAIGEWFSLDDPSPYKKFFILLEALAKTQEEMRKAFESIEHQGAG